MELQEKIRLLLEYIPTLIKELAEKFPIQMQSLIAAEMDIGEPDNAWREAKPHTNVKAFSDKNTTWNKGIKLRSQTGGYIKSFLPNAPKTLTNVTKTRYGFDAVIGSEYFGEKNIHETGGFIKSKGKMHKFFWAKYIKSNNEFYKIMALSVIKTGGVNIKKRPSFTPAVKRYKDEVAAVWLDDILDTLVRHL